MLIGGDPSKSRVVGLEDEKRSNFQAQDIVEAVETERNEASEAVMGKIEK